MGRVLVTHISAATGALTWMGIEWFKQGKPTVIGIATGMVAGLATITPAAGVVGPEGALLIGFMAGIVCFYATQAIKGVFGIDDSLDVFPVHGVGGMLGIIMLSFVGVEGGFLGSSAGGDFTSMDQFFIQLKGIAIIGLWTAIASWVILKVVSQITDLRVSDEDEYIGLDISEHEERSYDLT
jgi:Amt family ammonium transporter